MFKQHNLSTTSFLLALSVFMFACGGGSSTTEESNSNSTAFDETSEEVVEEIDKVIHELPPPSEVPFLLKATGADFNKDLVNSMDKVEDYLVDNEKSALSLGVYATDVGYFSSYDQVQDALKYLEGCQKLADKIGVSSVFDIRLMERFERNLSDRDSLASIINEAIEIAEKRLENNDRLVMVALVLAGSYIEGMYISTGVVETYPKIMTEEQRNLVLEPLVKIIVEQKSSLIDLIALLKDLPQDKVISRMVSELSILRILYDDLADIEFKIHDEKASMTLDRHILKDITTEVKRIRSEITE